MKALSLFIGLATFILFLAACPKSPSLSALPKGCGCSDQDPLIQCKAFLNGRKGFCPDSICPKSSDICSTLPYDVDVASGVGYDDFSPVCQSAFDWFSWQTFIALNWPANPDGSPMKTPITAAPGAPRVWETYEGPNDVFGLQAYPKDGLLHLNSNSKGGFDHFNGGNSNLEAFTNMPLIDRNLNFVLYDVKINPDEVDYIRKNKLNTYCGQDSFQLAKKNVQFPLGSYEQKKVGAMEIKSSWRILVPGLDDTTRYYKRRAVIHVSRAMVFGHNTAINDTVWVGLIALHIVRRVNSEGENWIWSSFEHEDNAPDCPQGCLTGAGNYSFYNPGCTSCQLNAPPSLVQGDQSFMWSTSNGRNPQYARRYATNGKYGTQVGRLYPIESATVTINEQWQTKLNGTVWQHYKLIGSQWASEENGASTVGIPVKQANTVVETYLQPLNQKTGFSGSCITCHAVATTAVGQNANFSFLLGIPDSVGCNGK